MVSRPSALFIAVLLATSCLCAQAPGCFAYRKNDDLRLRCSGSGTDTLLLHRHALADFAIGEGAIALLTSTTDVDKTALNRIELIRNGRSETLPLDNPYTVYASCGTLLATSFPTPTYDLLTGHPFRPADKGMTPVCSRDRSFMVEIDETGEKVVVLAPGRAPSVVLAGVVGPPYGVSPSGQYFDYRTDSKLCIKKMPDGRPVCYSAPVADSKYVLSTDDAGRVLYLGLTGGTCYYSGAIGQDLTPDGGHGHLWDACYGIFVVSPNSPPKLLLKRADDPEWVDAAAVKALLAGLHPPRAQRALKP